MSSDSSNSLERIMQAVHAVQAGEYSPALLAELIEAQDELGQLARVVDALANGVSLRDHQLELLRRVIPIGVSLSAEKDFDRLLETLVAEAQSVTNADGGTLYLLDEDQLRFVILRNTSLGLKMGGTSGNPISFDPVQLHHEDGSENRANVASYAALSRKHINLADAYEAEGFDFSGTRIFDQRSGYRSRSFLTLPLEGDGHKIIGVLQLINAKNPATDEIVPFADDDALDALVLLASAALDGYIREQSLRQEIAKLRIEINESRRASTVADITDTQYFKLLQDRARELRSRHGE